MKGRTLSRILLANLVAALALLSPRALPVADALSQATETPTTFAVIGDYGVDNGNEPRWQTSWRPGVPPSSSRPAMTITRSRGDGDRQIRRVHRRLLRRMAQRHRHDGDALPGGTSRRSTPSFPLWGTTITATLPRRPIPTSPTSPYPASVSPTPRATSATTTSWRAGPLLRAQLQHAGAGGTSSTSRQAQVATARNWPRPHPPWNIVY